MNLFKDISVFSHFTRWWRSYGGGWRNRPFLLSTRPTHHFYFLLCWLH